MTPDHLAPRHTAASLEAAYAGASALSLAGLGVVCAPLPAPSGRFTVDTGAGVPGVTPWWEGRSPTEAEAARPGHVREVDAVPAAPHGAAPPEGLRHWAPRVGPGFADELRARTADAELLAAGAGDRLRPDPAMAELFALDRRLSGIVEYAGWFAAPHTGTDDDHVALRGLYEELSDAPG
ncbi:hypothetical protein [Streptomyces sp. NPDC059092]|uniref:hypothetical protein n=1 Tax=Streptomyces sp. NPDC059092 TaxID=3346725 RepID=UPI0036C52118